MIHTGKTLHRVAVTFNLELEGSPDENIARQVAIMNISHTVAIRDNIKSITATAVLVTPEMLAAESEARRNGIVDLNTRLGKQP